MKPMHAHARALPIHLFRRDKIRLPWEKPAVTLTALFALTSILPALAVGVVAVETQSGSPNVWQGWVTLGALLGGILTAMILTIYRAKDEEYRHLSPVLMVALNVARALIAAPASLLSLTFVFAKWPDVKLALSEHWLLMSSAGAVAAIPFYVFMAVTILRLDRIKGKVADTVVDAAEKKLAQVLPPDTGR